MGVKEVMHYAKDAQREERGQVVQRNNLRQLGWRHQCQRLRPWCMIIVGVEARRSTICWLSIASWWEALQAAYTLEEA